jgi:two-component system, OmpR family, sensor histidine kinase KdpD
LSSDLATATTTRQVAQAVVDHVSHTFNAQAGVLLPENDILMPCCTTANFVIGQEEVGVAVWAFQHGQHAGHNTDTLPTARARYLPLKTAKAVVGVLGVFLEPSVSPERRRLLEAFASQGALAIEAIRQAEQAREAQLLREKEKLQSALLNSISHDLRTPLVSVTGALSSLKDDSGLLDKKAQRELVETALEEANRLNWLVGNLLDMTRLESNALYLKKEPCDVQDIIGVALSQMRERLRSRETQLDIPPDLPLMSADFVLIVQVLVNLLDNAVKYTPAWEPIEVCARQHGEMVEIEVADHGKGIPPSAFEHIFEKFYRVNDLPEDASGTGLGLSIVKGIVEAHKGIIEVQNRPGGGASFRFSVPIHRTERITA